MKATPHILVVEDDEDHRVLVTNLLPTDAEVSTAASAEEALELLASTSVDVVLTDLTLPGSSGRELLAELRERGDASCRVLAMSAQLEEAERRELLALGFDACLSKFELSATDLRSLLGELVPAAREAPARSDPAREALDRRFRERLPGRVAELRALADPLAGREDVADGLVRLHRAVHNLAGSAGSYGFVELSEVARDLARWLKPLGAGERVAMDERDARIATALDDLEARLPGPDGP